jgi:acyl-CoA thioester hydrolase
LHFRHFPWKWIDPLMNESFVAEFRARWADMDFNQHMGNAAYLACSEETRIGYLARNGWTMEHFAQRQIGPVVLEERLIYKKEIKLHEPFRVDLMLAGITADGRRFKIRNRFFRPENNALCAIVESTAVWFDLNARKPLSPPPPELRDIWNSLARTDDFVMLE